MKTINGHEIIQLFEEFSPKKFAEEGDKIGLQIGSLSQKVDNVMVTLDVLDHVVDEAIKNNVQLIIAHHPPLFRSLKSIQTDTYQGKMIEKLIKHDIAVYAAHTNLDVAKGGVNDLLADALQLQNTEVLVPTFEDKLRKLIVYVPEEQAEAVRTAIGDAGAGHIGNYSHCSFSTDGVGSFLPGENTNPHIGEKGKVEQVKEIKIETIYPLSKEKAVLRAMKQAHPYEEVAYDLFPLSIQGEMLGLGRIGKVERPFTLKEFSEFVKDKLQLNGIRVVGDLDTPIRKVAVLGGDGNKFIYSAARKGADVLVTGDLYYHTAHDAMMLGLNVIDAGHHIEQIMKKGVVEHLAKRCAEKGYIVNIFSSRAKTDPFTFL